MFVFKRTGSTGTTSKYWSVKFRGHDGRQILRTTRCETKEDAIEIGSKWERAARLAANSEFTQATSLAFFNDLLRATTAEELDIPRVGAYFDTWFETKRVLAKAEGTLSRYEPVLKGFVASLPERRRTATLASLTAIEIERFRNAERTSGKSASTVNFGVKVLRAALNTARRQGLITTNPAEAVEMLTEEGEQRIPFDADQVRSLIRHADTEWRGMILFGFHAGLRLTDCANLTWANVDPVRHAVTFRPKKTAGRKRSADKETTVALHRDIISYLDALPTNDNPTAPLFPSLHGKPSGSHGGLSNAFNRLMQAAQIRIPVGVKKEGKGRQFRALGFHSLRHSFVSRLANAEVSADVRKQIVGHSSDEIHQRYVHLELTLQENALGKLDSVL
jgi:integrase